MDRARHQVERVAWMFAGAFACAFAPSCKQAPPPLGEAIVIVDTDAPIPSLAGRLRIDFYSGAGEWFESRDVAAPDPSAWPISFSVFTPDEANAHTVIVRLRAYAEGKTRSYRGERFAARGDVEPTPVDKRLLVAGADVTPRTEPQPLLTIDRLLQIVLDPGHVGSVRTVLRGACFGTMADLAMGETCVDTENVRAPLATAAIDPDTTIPHDTLAGAFGKPQPCAGAPRADEVCVPGGAFVLGNASNYGVGPNSGVPERIALMSAFYIDRHEYTVARWREAYPTDRVAFGKHVTFNNGPLDTTSSDPVDDHFCSASAAPLGRESFALTCLDWDTARALCIRDGGDLASEAQWEYAAQAAGRPSKTTFPWGEDPLTCDRAVYARFVGIDPLTTCNARGTGPTPVGAAEHARGDVTVLGIVGLGGGVTEMLRDAFFAYDASCWRHVGQIDPGCPPEAGPDHSMRGASWAVGESSVASENRAFVEQGKSAPSVGFRCVRGGTGSN